MALNDSVMLSAQKNKQINLYTQRLEYSFAISSLIAGAMAVFLEKRWFYSINDAWKVPVYGMMGSSYSFIVIYMIVDILEILKEFTNCLSVQLVYYFQRLKRSLFGKTTQP